MPSLSVDGCRVRYRQQGSGRPPLLLLHSAGGSSLPLLELINLLSPRRRVVACDLPGHGQSGPLFPEPRASELLERYAEVAAELAERVGLGRYVVVGHSMGGAIGLLMAERFAERIAAVVVVASAARLPMSPPLRRALEGPADDLVAFFAANGYSPHSGPARGARWARDQLQCSRRQLLADFGACDRFDMRNELSRISQPVTVIAPTDDLLTPPRAARSLAARLPRARLELLDRAGHFAVQERPRAVAQLIERCLVS